MWYVIYIKLINSKWWHPRFLQWVGGVFCRERIWNNYVEIQWKSMRLYLLFFCAPEDIILYAIRPGRMKFEGKYFYKLIRSKGWQHASLVRITTNLTQKWPKWNDITQRIWLWVYQEQFVILSVNQGLVINLTWRAVKNKQRFERFLSLFDISWSVFFFLNLFFYLYLKSFPHKAVGYI